MFQLDHALKTLGNELIHSPFLAVMIVNQKYQILWHNQKFAEEFGGGAFAGEPCFKTVGSQTVHEGCPLQQARIEHIRIKGVLDFGDKDFLFLTIPLDDEHAAKVHLYLPKENRYGVEEA